MFWMKVLPNYEIYNMISLTKNNIAESFGIASRNYFSIEQNMVQEWQSVIML